MCQYRLRALVFVERLNGLLYVSGRIVNLVQSEIFLCFREMYNFFLRKYVER